MRSHQIQCIEWMYFRFEVPETMVLSILESHDFCWPWTQNPKFKNAKKIHKAFAGCDHTDRFRSVRTFPTLTSLTFSLTHSLTHSFHSMGTHGNLVAGCGAECGLPLLTGFMNMRRRSSSHIPSNHFASNSAGAGNYFTAVLFLSHTVLIHSQSVGLSFELKTSEKCTILTFAPFEMWGHDYFWHYQVCA